MPNFYLFLSSHTKLFHMHESPRKSKWLVVVLITIAVLGLIPWEAWLAIEIRTPWLHLCAIGLGSLFALVSLSVMSLLRRKNAWSAVLGMFLAAFTLFPLAAMIFFSFLFPDFRWQDSAVYKNNDQYLVKQEYESFVTNSDVAPRILLTSSPYGMFRKIKIVPILDIDPQKDHIIYNGKMWEKQVIPDE